MIEKHFNLVPIQYQNFILDKLTNSKFPWYFWHQAIPDYLKPCNRVEGDRFINPTQLKHVFLVKDNKTNEYDMLLPIINAYIKRTGKKLLKVHAAAVIMQHPESDSKVIKPHVDYSELEHNNSELITLIYYVNNSDGDTYLYNEFCTDKITNNVTLLDKLSPKKGLVATFNSNRFHSGSVPSKSIRMLITIIMELAK